MLRRDDVDGGGGGDGGSGVPFSFPSTMEIRNMLERDGVVPLMKPRFDGRADAPAPRGKSTALRCAARAGAIVLLCVESCVECERVVSVALCVSRDVGRVCAVGDSWKVLQPSIGIAQAVATDASSSPAIQRIRALRAASASSTPVLGVGSRGGAAAGGAAAGGGGGGSGSGGAGGGSGNSTPSKVARLPMTSVLTRWLQVLREAVTVTDGPARRRRRFRFLRNYFFPFQVRCTCALCRALSASL
jgi:hypothetical protein